MAHNEHKMVKIMNRKGQIKMMETIAVLLVFLILLSFVVVFYANMSTSSQGSDQADKANLQAIQIAQLISYMPEFQCSSRNIIIENCFDILKMQAFMNYTTTTDGGQNALDTSYFDLFAYSHIVVQGIYPDDDSEWTVYSRQPSATRYNNQTVFIPVSLFNATAPGDSRYMFGLLNITVHS